MEIKLFENFNRLTFKDYKTNRSLKEIPNLEEYLQDILDLGYTEIIVECTLSDVKGHPPYLSLSIKIIYGNSDNDELEKDFENLAELMTTSIESKDRIVGDGWTFGGFSTDDGDDYFTQKYLTLYFGKQK